MIAKFCSARLVGYSALAIAVAALIVALAATPDAVALALFMNFIAACVWRVCVARSLR